MVRKYGVCYCGLGLGITVGGIFVALLAPVLGQRADATGRTSSELLAALYEAALKDFPQPAVNPRRVTVTLPR